MNIYSIEKKIRKAINLIGFDLKRLKPSSNPMFQLFKALDQFKVDLVFDVGANVGQFASELRNIGFQGDIISFEPLPIAHQDLIKAARNDSKWHVYPRSAVGDYDGEVEINVAGNSASSSILPMLELHALAEPGSAYVKTEKAPIFRLDSIASRYLENSSRPFLKIDTQGYEWRVLNGAHNTLPKLKGILCELSLTPLYKGQLLWLDMINYLEGKGFSLWSIQPVFTDPRDGRTLQVDAIFFRV